MWNLIFVRMWRERRTMAVLLLGMCMVTGFLALSPLYVDAIAAADLEQRVESASDRRFLVSVTNQQPLEPQSQQIAEDIFGRFQETLRPYRSVNSFTCGLLYEEGLALDEMRNSITTHCYRPYAYPSISDLFNVVDGRAPEVIPPDSDRYADAEALMARSVAGDAGFSVGDYIIIGQDPDSAVIVEIVGLMQPVLPESDVFWQQQTVLDTLWTIVNQELRFDVSLVMPQQAFDRYIPDTFPVTYYWQIGLQRDLITPDNIDEIESRIDRFTRTLPQNYPDVNISSSLREFITDYRAGIAAARGPVLMLSLLVMVLMLYNLVTISTLILEQQTEEWSMFASRGGSVAQLISIQFVTTGILALLAGLLGLPVAYLILLILSIIGPQSEILTVGLPQSIPLLSLGLSAGAALTILLVLLIPAWQAANSSALHIKRGISRPPVQPIWARFFLDLICLGVGTAFILRLFTLSSDAGLGTLLENPALLIEVISQQGATSLNDPFNIAGPALLLIGTALLWMRIFPLLMRTVGKVFDTSDGLTARLAFWNVERNPAHYAQLVLLMIGTLALGTSSLALSQTREVGAWQAALTETGAEASIELNPRQIDRNTDWQSLPGVNDALPFLYAVAGTNGDQALIGLPLSEQAALNDSDTDNGFAIQDESLMQALDALANASYGNEGGVVVPADAQALRIDIQPEAPQESGTITTAVSLHLIDHFGFETDLELQATNAEPTAFDRFITYEGSLADAGQPPFRITEIRLDSRHSEKDEFQHRVYLDSLRSVQPNGQQTVLVPFEEDAPDEWDWPSALRRLQVLESTAFTPTEQFRTEGDYSMGVLYSVRQSGALTQGAVLRYYNLAKPPVPAVISAQFAEVAGQRSRFRRALEVGDTISSNWTVPAGQNASATIEINYTVVDIIQQFPGLVDPDGQVLIADLDILRRRLNLAESPSEVYDQFAYYDLNRVWLSLDGREPAPELQTALQEINGFERVSYAYNRYQGIQREPLANSLTGMLFAGFWVALLLGLIDFAFYMAMTIRRRAVSFATLRAIGWNERDLLRLLFVEQAAFITPALIIGVLLGLGLAYLILPFLALIGSQTLQLPLIGVLLLLLVFVIAFALILRLTAAILHRFSLNQVMRFGE